MDGGNVDGTRAVAVFCPDCTETNTIRRAQGFLDEGYGVTVFGFRRGRYNPDFIPPWPYVPLGRTADRRYWQRLWAGLRALPVVLRKADRLRNGTAIYARNLDQLALAIAVRWFLRARGPVAYEVLDIAPVMTGRSLASVLLRALERFCLRRVRLLVLSSPGFYAHYFARIQRFRGDWFLLENKLHRSVLQVAPHRHGAGGVRAGRRPGRPWVIGYFGLIRGDATLDLIVRLAERLGDRVQFRFRGVLTTIKEARFAAVLRRCPNIVHGGPYVNPRDLAELYRAVDFAWAVDLNDRHNSRWLLPCRFYEAGYFGVPCLAGREFEVGRLIDRLGVGWTFSAPFEDMLVRFFETLTPEQYEERRRHLEAQPLNLFVAGADMADLCERLQPVRPPEHHSMPPPSRAVREVKV